jgi:S1-C subfamily serine protease
MRIAALLLLSSAALSQQPASPVPPMPSPVVAPKPDILDHWRRATVALGQDLTIGGKRQFVTTGSAVIVAVDATHAWLLTAKHMFFNPNEGYVPTQVSMRLPKDSTLPDTDFGVVIPLIVNGVAQWKTTQESSDLAVVALPDLSKYKDIHAVGLQDFGITDDVYQGAGVVVLGYPGILGETYQTTPILRGGLVAWVDPDKSALKPFLIDANIFSGNSGGPVFHSRSGVDRFGNLNVGGGYSFIGIVSEDAYEYSDVFISDKATYAKQLTAPNIDPTKRPDSVIAQVKNIGGIGVIEPVSKIRELLGIC